MPFMISRRQLDPGDYDAWLQRFEAGAAERKAAGCRGVQRFHGLDDPRELLVIFEWDSVDNARAFVARKLFAKPELSEQRDDGSAAKLESMFYEQLAPLES